MPFCGPDGALMSKITQNEANGRQDEHGKARKKQSGDLRFLTHPTVNVLVFRVGGLEKDIFKVFFRSLCDQCFNDVVKETLDFTNML